jgi:hypothetical protein
MMGAGIVKVHSRFDESLSKNAVIEINVLLGVTGHRCNMMDARNWFCIHKLTPFCF